MDKNLTLRVRTRNSIFTVRNNQVIKIEALEGKQLHSTHSRILTENPEVIYGPIKGARMFGTDWHTSTVLEITAC